MNFLKNLKRTVKQFTKRASASVFAVLFATSLLAGVPLHGVTHAEFYPDRPTYDYNKFDPTKPCTDPANAFSRCGSMTGPVFNSFINTPSAGDERAFLDARRSDQTAAGSYKNVLADVDQGSKEVVIRMYIHNNANQTTNESGVGIAHGTKVRVLLPTATAQVQRARGYISADNAAMVEDTVDFTAGQQFTVQYVPGSAILYDNDNFKSGTAVNDSIVTTGAPIGSDALDGNFKGCFEYEAVVQLHVKITPKKPTVEFTKEVNIADQKGWTEKVNVKPGTRIKWLITFHNNGQTDLTKVNISDQLPAHLSVVPGSVKWIYTGTSGATQEAAQSDTQLFTTGGVDFNTWKPNAGFYLRFETIAKDDFEGCQITLRNVAFNKTEQTGKTQDTADVVITKENCKPTTPPTLPNTGAGDMIGIFVSVTVAGAIAHRLFWIRRAKTTV